MAVTDLFSMFTQPRYPAVNNSQHSKLAPLSYLASSACSTAVHVVSVTCPSILHY